MIMISSVVTNLVTENGKLSDYDIQFNDHNENNNDIYNDNLNDNNNINNNNNNNNNNDNNNNYYYNEDVQSNFDEDFDSFFWHGRFIPPPPRPPFLNNDVTSDGPTTCGLCTWSQYKSTHSFFDAPFDSISELGLPIILIIVAFLSAIFGAIGMITFIKCKRKRKFQNERSTRNSFRHHHQQQQQQHQQLQFHHCEHQCCQFQLQQQHHLQCMQQPHQQDQQQQQPHLENQACTTNGKCLFDNCTENNNEHNRRNPEVWIWLKNVNTSMNLDESLITPQITSPQNYYTNTDGPTPQIRQNEAVYEEITGVG